MKKLYSLLLVGVGLVSQAQTYCAYTAPSVNAITFVSIKDESQKNTLLSNYTDKPDSAPHVAHELFLDKVVHTYAGKKYWIRFAGFTPGNFALFVDWNQNGVLDDEGEVYQYSATGAYDNPSGDPMNQRLESFTVPAGLAPGERRMRIINYKGATPNPCGNGQAGQAEDYTLSIDSEQDSDTYCAYKTNTISAITNVTFAGINNTTDATSTSQQEYFLTKQAVFVKGNSPYSISVQGNTNGNNTDYYTLFIDWNKNNKLDDAGEVYQLGTIANSTGTDGQKISFQLPDDINTLPLGPTRLRVIKNRGSYATTACGDFEVGQAEDYTLTVRNPVPGTDIYCGPLKFGLGSNPITNVEFAGIKNRSSNVINSNNSPNHEYFLDVKGTVEKGQTYDITLEGNTAGNWTDNYTVYIDWNHNNDFTDPGEKFDIGSITFSDGQDGKQLKGTITVPYASLSGETRMRVISRYGTAGSYTNNPCTTDNEGGNSAVGQAEDYTIQINSICIEPTLSIENTSVEACAGSPAVLEATTEGQVYWYDSATATVPVGSGLIFTPTLTQDTTFWAEATSGVYFGGGKTAPQSVSAGSVNPNSKPWGLAFNVNETVTLNSVDVYVADANAGNLTIQLLSTDLKQLYTKTFALPAGSATKPVKVELPLGFVIPAGSYKLVTESTVTLVRELNQSGFPYALGTSGSITDGTIGTGSSNKNYYFFYNWKLNTGDAECKSARQEVSVHVNAAPEAPAGEQSQKFTEGQTLNDLVVTGANLTWYSDEMKTTVLPTTTTLVDGTTYYVSQNDGQCESALLAVTVHLDLAVSDLNKAEFSYYPNPVKDALNISAKNNIAKIEIFDASGKLVLVKDAVAAKNVSLNVSSFHSGVYMVKATSEKGIETFRIIKK